MVEYKLRQINAVTYGTFPPDGTWLALVLDRLNVVGIIKGRAHGVGTAVTSGAGDSVVALCVSEQGSFLLEFKSIPLVTIITTRFINPGTAVFRSDRRHITVATHAAQAF